MKVRQERLGHSDASITLGVYTHVVGEDSRVAASRLGNVVWGLNQRISASKWPLNKNGLASVIC